VSGTGDRVSLARLREFHEPKSAGLELCRQLVLQEMVGEVWDQIIANLRPLATPNHPKNIGGRGHGAQVASRFSLREEGEQDRCVVRYVRPQLPQEANAARPVLHERVAGPSDDDPVAHGDLIGAFVAGRQSDARPEPFAREELVGASHELRIALEGDDVEATSLQRYDLTASAGRGDEDRAAALKVSLDRGGLPGEES